MSTSNVPAVAEKYNTVKAMVEKNKAAIEMAIPKHLSADRFSRIFYTTLLKSPKLLECDPKSLVSALIQCAELGLEPLNTLGQVSLVPFWNGRLKKFEVQVIPGYRGYATLAYNSGKISDITAHVVYNQEPFEISYGTVEEVKHKPLPPSERGDRKIGAYCRTAYRDGTIKITWMWAEEILKHREQSQGVWEFDYQTKRPKLDKDGNKILNPESPWVKWEDEMWCKTAIRNAAKMMPLSPEFRRAESLDTLAEAGKSQREPLNIEDVSDIIDITTDGEEERNQEVMDDKSEALKRRLAEAKAVE